ncbi:hypothetical protein BVC80_9069g28 [Macleaya cordata]|uniref:Uncharacterized protein n=1 Tax=Macleaya cordata TaxID=56857 RepID=A0A200PNZ4_MACCD|nr:hypothetical protein BVC80_9069g28 [Macleaya cordata]
MATSTREARRRRIVERGEDRLALITGRIQALDSSSSSSSQPQQQPEPEPEPQLHHAHTFSSPPLLSRQDQIRYDFRSDRSFVTPDDDIDENDVPGTLLPKHETSNESPSSAAADSGNQVEPLLRKCETNVDTMRSPPLDISSPVLSTVEDSSKITPSDTRPLSRAEPRSHPKLFTAKRISSSITASENSRILCSITIALLVVLSHLSLPILSSGIVKNFLTSRPLYLVLLGNITIVLARLLFGKQGGSKKAEEEARKVPSEEPNGSKAMDVGKALDTGLLMYKAFRAAFMDCSVYAVIVVCGLSLLQRSL